MALANKERVDELEIRIDDELRVLQKRVSKLEYRIEILESETNNKGVFSRFFKWLWG